MSKSFDNTSNKYDAIMRAGEALLSEGYEKAQLRSIAELAGVSLGLFYRYFANKRELLAAVLERHHIYLQTQIVEEVALCDHPLDALECVILLTLRYFRQHQGFIKLFFMEIGYGDAEVTEKLKKVRQSYRNILLEILENGISKQVFLDQDILDVEVAINSIIGTIAWSVYNTLVVKNKDIEPEDLAAKIFSFMSRSLLKECITFAKRPRSREDRLKTN